MLTLCVLLQLLGVGATPDAEVECGRGGAKEGAHEAEEDRAAHRPGEATWWESERLHNVKSILQDKNLIFMV